LNSTLALWLRLLRASARVAVSNTIITADKACVKKPVATFPPAENQFLLTPPYPLNSTLPSTFPVIGDPRLNEINGLRWFLC
jgi:hypothetical protein